MNKLLSAAAIVFVVATNAQAADMAIYKKAPPAPVWSWTGSYIGAFVGGAWADPSTRVPTNAAATPLFPGANVSYDLNSSVIAGITSGYNWQFAPNWLIGYEGETGYIHMRGTGAFPGSTTSIASTEVGDIYTAWTARVGYVMDKSLFYAKGGAVLARFESNIVNAPGTLPLGLTNRKYELGYAVGGGWEYAFDPKWSIKAEYLYLGFDGNNLDIAGTSTGFAIRGGGAIVTPEFSSTTLPGIHTVKVGLNYKWDWFGMLR